MEDNLEKLKFPIGKFEYDTNVPVEVNINKLSELPGQIAAAVGDLSGAGLDKPYRPGGWTIRQVIHHLPDSHMNAYIRFKLALTESNPQIRPYNETLWAECGDAREGDIEVSLRLLQALHERWVLAMRNMSARDWDRSYYHPEHASSIRLREVLSMYVWHGLHHHAHILAALGLC